MCDINYHVEVYVGLIVTPAGIKYIVYFDGVQLGYILKVIFSGDDDVVAVVIVMTIDGTVALYLIDGEG